MKFVKLFFTCIGLLYTCLCIAYDTEIDGLRYDWVSYYNANKTGGDVSLVGYSSSELTENLVIPCSIKWNESRKGHEGRNCQVCTVEKNAFEGCTILKSISFGCVQSIMGGAFKDCSSLEEISFSNTILSILPLSFSGCTSLSEIHLDKNTPPTGIYEDSFDEEIYKKAILFVPEGCVEAYRNSDGWNKFVNISDGSTNTFVLSVTTNGSGSVTYNGTNIRNETSTFEVHEETSATITFIPDNGCRTKSVIINETNVTKDISDNQYTISNINSNTTVEVEFEAIPSIIEFADANVKAICVANWDTDGDGELSEEEAAAVSDLGDVFKYSKTLTSFNELNPL